MDVKGEIVRIFQSNIEEKNLLIKVEENKKSIINAMQKEQGSVLQVDNTLLDTSSVLAYLSNVFEAQKLTVNNIRLLKVRAISGVSTLPVKVNAVGSFSDFFKLIYALAEGSRPMVINDFSFKRDSHGVVAAEIQLLMFGVHVKAVTLSDREDLLENAVSLEKMKWGGFLQDGDKSWGLLMLPDGKTIEVEVGDVMGVERGKVIEVKEDEISLTVAGKMMKITPTSV